MFGVVVASMAFGWLGAKVNRARNQQKAVQRVLELGGSVRYDTDWDPYATIQGNTKTDWLRNLFGDHFFDKVKHVMLGGTAVTDGDLELFQYLPNVEDIYLSGSNVSDDGMMHLKHLQHLERLSLYQSQIGERVQRFCPSSDN